MVLKGASLISDTNGIQYFNAQFKVWVSVSNIADQGGDKTLILFPIIDCSTQQMVWAYLLLKVGGKYCRFLFKMIKAGLIGLALSLDLIEMLFIVLQIYFHR